MEYLYKGIFKRVYTCMGVFLESLQPYEYVFRGHTTI